MTAATALLLQWPCDKKEKSRAAYTTAQVLLYFTLYTTPTFLLLPNFCGYTRKKVKAIVFSLLLELKSWRKTKKNAQSAFTFTWRCSLFTSLVHVFRQLLTVEVKANDVTTILFLYNILIYEEKRSICRTSYFAFCL